VRSLLEIREANVVIQRWDISCGAAALATLLTYQHGDPVPEKAIAEAMLGRTDPLRVKARGGFSLLDLKRYVEARGYEGDGYAEMSLEELEELGPAIVPVTFLGDPHFVVYRGRIADRVLLADPAFGNRTVDVTGFEKAWEKIAFTVNRRDGAALPNRLSVQPHDGLRVSPDMIRSAVMR
jgi:predicted double-glycine peptidase